MISHDRTASTLLLAGVCSLSLALAACGSRGAPLPPIYPNPPAISGLTVAQRGSFVILRFPQPELTARVGSEDVETQEVEVLVYAERYPALTVDMLVAGLARRRDIMVSDAESEAAATAAREAAEAAEAAGEPLAEEPESETAPRRRTADEQIMARIPPEIRELWRGEGMAGDAILEAGGRLVEATDELWNALGLPQTVLDPSRPQPLPDPGRIAEQSRAILEEASYERQLTPGPFLARASVSRRIPVEQFGELQVDEMLQVALPVGPPAPADLRTRYFFAVRSSSTNQTPGEVRQIAAIAPAPVPVAPTEVVVDIGGDGVELSWAAPAGDLALRRVDPTSLRYNIYRLEPGGIAGPTPLNTAPIEGETYTDGGMQWGETYVYELRAMREGSRTPRRESDGVKTDEVEVIDRYPPAPATDLRPTRAGRRVTLQWTPSDSIDLIGYRVYRHPEPAPPVPVRFDPTIEVVENAATPPPTPTQSRPPVGVEGEERNEMTDGGWELLTDDPVPFSSFTDSDADPSITYVYAVEALDAAGNLSALVVASESGDREP